MFFFLVPTTFSYTDLPYSLSNMPRPRDTAAGLLALAEANRYNWVVGPEEWKEHYQTHIDA